MWDTWTPLSTKNTPPKGKIYKFVYIWVGNSEIQCPGQCAWPFHPPNYGPQGPALFVPNNDIGSDGMVINLTSLLVSNCNEPFWKSLLSKISWYGWNSCFCPIYELTSNYQGLWWLNENLITSINKRVFDRIVKWTSWIVSEYWTYKKLKNCLTWSEDMEIYLWS